jgi:acetyl-CoA carboxylase biotin carboxylase subunit
VELVGHAVECRLSAEDTEHGFRPSPGTISRFSVPPLAGLRVDTHCRAGTRVPPFYDSLLAKLIGHGADRAEAIGVLCEALERMQIMGVPTNRRLLQRVLDHSDFVTGAVTTGWLEGTLVGLGEAVRE